MNSSCLLILLAVSAMVLLGVLRQWIIQRSSRNDDTFECPKEPPNEQGFITTAFPGCQADEQSFACHYGQVCCPNTENCIAETSCVCDERGFFYCYSEALENCPELCPKEPPIHAEACTPKDELVSCDYNPNYTCEGGADLSWPFQHSCSCYSGNWHCDSNECPLPCSEAKPVEGSKCDGMTGDCRYEFCCPNDATKCSQEICYCDDTAKEFVCFANGPLKCPNDDLGCPIEPPLQDDAIACEIPSRYYCAYGDTLECDSGRTYESHVDCRCLQGSFQCKANVCFPSCPTEKPRHDDSCTAPFEGFDCSYGQICCPSSQDCVPEHRCHCNPETHQIVCHAPELKCPELCPTKDVHTGDACPPQMIENLYCPYGNAGICETGEVYNFQSLCQCVEGIVQCKEHYCPLPCPSSPPPVDTPCMRDFSGIQCHYGQVCCQDFCIAQTICYCDLAANTVLCETFDETTCIDSSAGEQ